jgi:hypothetical protein
MTGKNSNIPPTHHNPPSPGGFFMRTTFSAHGAPFGFTQTPLTPIIPTIVHVFESGECE